MKINKSKYANRSQGCCIISDVSAAQSATIEQRRDREHPNSEHRTPEWGDARPRVAVESFRPVSSFKCIRKNSHRATVLKKHACRPSTRESVVACYLFKIFSKCQCCNRRRNRLAFNAHSKKTRLGERWIIEYKWINLN